ncbi:histidine kinase [Microbacterium xanthum]|uniref:histidine kinase n=1 Tax=Microbacterium xanthum TaxID=3079794 RepID=UPI002AD4C75D|nr:histidine kinase [Microbacterium sp. KSW-48]MDZ8171107.1 histidine kinase [Microbacterium sp. KSW-48]
MSRPAMRPIAAAGLALEAVGVAALAGWQIVALSSGDTTSTVSAIALLVLTVIGAVGLAAFAVAVQRGSSMARSGGIVAQLLVLAVALGAATGEYAHPAIAVAIAVPAVIELVLLVITAGQAARADAKATDDGA